MKTPKFSGSMRALGLSLGLLAGLSVTNAQEDFPGEADTFAEAESVIDTVNFQEPAAPARRPSRRQTYGSQTARTNAPSTADLGDYVASAPRMFGHLYTPPYQLALQIRGTDGQMGQTLNTILPSGGGGGRMSVADNNGALPADRFLFNYNHFEDVYRVTTPPPVGIPGAPANQRTFPVDRYTMGFEKSFVDGIFSVQMQLPLMGQFSFAGGGPPGGPPLASVAGGRVGNLGLITKALLWRTDDVAISTGLGFDLPTGSDVNGTLLSNRYRLQNDAVHLSPFVSFLASPTEMLFVQGFMQVDVATAGNRFEVSETPADPFTTRGLLTDQTLISLDLAAGRWVYLNPGASGLTGVAGLVEIHYVTTATDADNLQFNTTAMGPFGPTLVNYNLGSPNRRLDIVDMTFGVHTQWWERLQFRVGGVVPLTRAPDRSFTSEGFAQFNYMM